MKSRITVIGLGAGDLDQLPVGILRQLERREQKLFVRTKDHPVMESLEQKHIPFESFDDIYEQFDEFDEVYQAIANRLLEEAKGGGIVYAVPGHPMLAERTVQLLLEQEKQNPSMEVSIRGGKKLSR